MALLSSLASIALCACALPSEEADADVGGAGAELFSASGSVAAEATVYENTAGNNGGSYSELCVGNLAATTSTRRGFVLFNLPSIPAGSTVTRVQLTFTQELVRRTGGPLAATLRLHEVTSAWSEGAGGTNTRSCGGGTDVPGVDWTGSPSVSGTESGRESLSTADGAAIAFDTNVGTDDDELINDVQSWVNGGTNRGWRLSVLEEGTINNARSIRPGTLTVSWTRNNGSTCTVDSDCTSGNCVGSDGLDCAGRAGCVCCSAATCASACETCHGSSLGTCSPRPSTTVCRSASCTSGTATLQTNCNGSAHTCPAATTQDCTPYFCSGTACGSSCASNADCEGVYFCNASNVCEAVSDECLQGLDDCVALAACNDPTVALGDWTCTCPSGYSGNGRAAPGTGCTDVNECALGTDDCDVNATCTNTPGSFSCACNGPQWVGDGRICMDYDECTDPFYTAMCDANATCNNLVPSFECVCDAGYRGDGATCTEIDECAEGTDDCDVNASCTNTPGSWSCACNTGWTGDGRTCADVDECASPAMSGRCSSVATCNNLPGDWECVCNDGFRGDGFTCEDIPECIEGLDECDANATCNELVGSYSCTCNEHWEGSGVFCADIDECARGTGGCSLNEVCVNNVGAANDCNCAAGHSRADDASPCLVRCGDGLVGPGEQCDDASTETGDGCDALCEIEPGWACYEPTGGASICENTCGDGLIDAAEECDDGPANSDTEPDACRTICARASCGDEVLDTGEGCDDGPANSDNAADACRTTCVPAYCGDTVVDTGELCDPGGGVPGAAIAGACTTMCTADAGVDPADPPALTGGGGCGCRAASSSGGSGALFAVLVGLALSVRRRGARRRRARARVKSSRQRATRAPVA